MQDNDPNDSFESKKKDSNDEPESDFENAEIYDYEEMFADEGDSLEKEEEEEHSLEKFALLAITTAKTHLSKGEYIFAANTIRVGRSFRSTYRDPRLMSLWVEMGKIAPKEEIFSHWQLFSLREHKAPITGIAIDSKNKFLIVGSLRSEVSEDTIANTLVAYDLETKEIIKRFESIQGTTAFCLSNNEQFLVAADASDKTLKMFDVQTGSLIKSFTSHTDSITEVVITDNNFFIFSSSIDGTIKMWHIKSGLLLRTLDAGAAVTAMALSPEDRLIMSGDSNGVVKLWYAPTGECIWSLKRHKGEVSSLSFSENRKFVLSSGLDRKTYLWELNFGDFSTLLKRHTSPVASTCFTYDNGFAIFTTTAGKISFFDLKTLEEFYHIDQPEQNITVTVISKDSRYMATGTKDGLVSVTEIDWNLDVKEDLSSSQWDPRAEIHIKNFLATQNVLFEPLPKEGPITEEHIKLAMCVIPFWYKECMEGLVKVLSLAGCSLIDKEILVARIKKIMLNGEVRDPVTKKTKKLYKLKIRAYKIKDNFVRKIKKIIYKGAVARFRRRVIVRFRRIEEKFSKVKDNSIYKSFMPWISYLISRGLTVLVMYTILSLTANYFFPLLRPTWSSHMLGEIEIEAPCKLNFEKLLDQEKALHRIENCSCDIESIRVLGYSFEVKEFIIDEDVPNHLSRFIDEKIHQKIDFKDLKVIFEKRSDFTMTIKGKATFKDRPVEIEGYIIFSSSKGQALIVSYSKQQSFAASVARRVIHSFIRGQFHYVLNIDPKSREMDFQSQAKFGQ